MLVLSEAQISRTALVHVDDDSLSAAHIGTEGAPYLALHVLCSLLLKQGRSKEQTSAGRPPG